MNINDVQDVPKVANKLEAIFARQYSLAEKYSDIERYPWPWPRHPDVAENQIWFKDFLWRVAEELAESFEAAQQGDQVHQIEELSDALHFLVELMLMVGIYPAEIMALVPVLPITPETLSPPPPPPPPNTLEIRAAESVKVADNMGSRTVKVDVLDQVWNILPSWNVYEDPVLIEMYFDVVYNLGLAGNCLKNKRWKQSQVPTDSAKFHKLIIHSFRSLIALFKACGCTPDEIFAFYWKKSAVNQFRQRSKY